MPMSIDFSFKQSFINFQPDKFKSKEEILDAMISRMMSRLVEKAEAIAAQKNVPVLERLTMMMLALNVSDGNFGQELLKQIHKPQNALMHQKMEKSLLSGIYPIITDLIKEGTQRRRKAKKKSKEK